MPYGHRLSELFVNASSSGHTYVTLTGRPGPYPVEPKRVVLSGRRRRQFHRILRDLGV